MTTHSKPADLTSEVEAKAQEIDRTIRALIAAPIDRAFETGRLFNEIVRCKHYLALGYDSFEAYLENLETLKFKRSTAYRNMKLAEKFDRDKHGQLGVGKLRLLMADYVTDPFQLIKDGIPAPDGKGGFKTMELSKLSCRDLEKLLRKMRPAAGKKGRKKKQAEPAETVTEVTGGTIKVSTTAEQSAAHAETAESAPSRTMLPETPQPRKRKNASDGGAAGGTAGLVAGNPEDAQSSDLASGSQSEGSSDRDAEVWLDQPDHPQEAFADEQLPPSQGAA